MIFSLDGIAPVIDASAWVAHDANIIGRVVLMGVPFTFKWATDALAATPTTLGAWLPWLVGAPLALTVIYGLARVGSAAFIQARDALFAPVFMHAVRTLALQ